MVEGEDEGMQDACALPRHNDSRSRVGTANECAALSGLAAVLTIVLETVGFAAVC